MSETPSVPSPKGKSLLKGKIFGVPTIYIVGGFVVILAIVAYKMKSSSTASTTATSDPNSPDAASASGSTANPLMPTGTVVAPAAPPVPDTVAYADNTTWTKQAVEWLVSNGVNPGDAQLAIQHYLAGATLSFNEGAIRDRAVRQFGLPPDGFDAGPTLPAPAPPPPPAPTLPTPPPVVHAPPPAPPRVPTPSAPKPVVKAPVPAPSHAVVQQKTYIVRPGDNLTKIATTFHYPGGPWALYLRNQSVIGPNWNFITPGERLVVG